jgi:hypothetical protein
MRLSASRFLSYSILAVALGQWVTSPVHAQGPPWSSPHFAGSYVVDLTDPTFRHVWVKAAIPNVNGRLLTGAGGDGHIEGRWASKIEDLSIKTPTDAGLTWTMRSGPDDFFRYWHLFLAGEPYEGPVVLEYRVNLDYTREEHPFGNEQGGQYFGNAVYTVMKPIFLAAEAEGRWEVTFKLAPGQQLAVPWQASDAPNRYFVDSLRQLQANPLVYGDFANVSQAIGDFDFHLALPGEFSDFKDDLLRTITPLLQHYGRLFPETTDGRYMMVMFRSYADDGEGFTDGAAITTTRPISRETRVVWGDSLAHEIFHYWNGRRLRGDPSWERQWFSEGFTEYYALLSLVNLGLMDEGLFVKQHLGNYLYFFNSGLYAGVTIREAGKDKGNYRHGVYSGGFVIALELDQRIRERSGGKRTLDDMMRHLYEQVALAGQRYAFDDLVAAASGAAGEDMSGFFRTYVSERNALDPQDVVGRLGLVANSFPYGNELYLLPAEKPDESQSRLWRWFLSDRFRHLEEQE